MSSSYDIAREQGYSDEEIKDYLSKKDPSFSSKFDEALKAGYEPEEIFKFKEQKKPKENTLGRHVARSEARAVETVLGAPRAFGEFLEGLIPEKLIKKGAEKVGLKEPVEKGFEFAKKYAPYKLLPKSEDVREFGKFLFGKKLEPRNEWEAKADEIVSDFAALALPIPGNKLRVIKPALLAMGGNIASDVVGRMGGSEKEKTYAKLGTFVMGSLINPKSAETLKNSLYEQARNARPSNAMVDAFHLKRNINQYRTELQKGGTAPYKTNALKKLDEIEEAAKSGDIGVDQLEQFKISINSMRAGLYEEFKGNAPGRKLAKASLDKVSKIVDEGLDVYGISNPQWESFYRPANEVHGAIQQSHRARNFIGRVAKKYGHHLILPALGLGHVAGVGPAIGTAVATGALTTGAVTGGEIIAKISKSPTLRKHYTNLINAALKEDVVAVEANLKKLEKELQEQD